MLPRALLLLALLALALGVSHADDSGFVQAELEDVARGANPTIHFDSEPLFAHADATEGSMLEAAAGAEAQVEMQGQSMADAAMELEASLQAEANAAAAAAAASQASVAVKHGARVDSQSESQGIFDSILNGVKNVLKNTASTALNNLATRIGGGGAAAGGDMAAPPPMPETMPEAMPADMGAMPADPAAGAVPADASAAIAPPPENPWGGSNAGQVGMETFTPQPGGLDQQALPATFDRTEQGILGAINEISGTPTPGAPTAPIHPSSAHIFPPLSPLLTVPLPPIPPSVPSVPAPPYPQRIRIRPLPEMPPLIKPRPEPVWSRVEREVERRRRAREARRRASQPLPLPQEHVHDGFKMPGRAPTPQELSLYAEQSRQLASQHKLHQKIYLMNHQLQAAKEAKAKAAAKPQTKKGSSTAHSMLESGAAAEAEAEASRNLNTVAPAALNFAPGTVANKAQECSNEGRRRIRQCINLLGAMALPNAAGQVNFDRERVLQACEDKARSPQLKSQQDELMCRQMRAHMLEVAELNQLEQSMRSEDVHNTCVKLLSAQVNGQAWLSQADSVGCGARGARQDEGVTGARCLFFHGSGVGALHYDERNTVPGAFDGFLPSYPAYWRGAEAQLSGSCDARFFVTDTTQRGWDSVELQEEYCRAISAYKPHTIFAHSSANLVLAAAIANGVEGCANRVAKAADPVKAGQSVWVALNAPWDGTPLADALAHACARVDGQAPDWYKGVCDTQAAAPYKGFAALSPSYVNKAAISLSRDEKFGRAQFNCAAPQIVNHFAPTEPLRADCVNMRSIGETYASAALCGLFPAGIHAQPKDQGQQRSDWIFLGEVANLRVDWGSDRSSRLSTLGLSGHDGLTPWSSCRLQSRAFGTAPTAAFYASLSSVHDGRCAAGKENAANAAQQPCSWMRARLSEALARFTRLAPGPQQSFVGADKVAGLPQQTPLSPNFSAFKYEFEAIETRVKHQLADDDAAAASYTPVKTDALHVAPPKRQRRMSHAARAALQAKKLEAAAERKRQDDLKAVSQAKLDQYLAKQA